MKCLTVQHSMHDCSEKCAFALLQFRRSILMIGGNAESLGLIKLSENMNAGAFAF